MNPQAGSAPSGDHKASPLPLSLLWGPLIVFLLGIAAAWGWKGYREYSAAQTALPVYGTVGDFTLVDRSGQPFDLSDLQGRISVLNFFFSSCTELCPLTMAQMARLQKPLVDAEEVRLVSITVDPEHDTPSVLTEYAQRFVDQPGRWFFLTGDKKAIYALSLNTFHLAVEEIPEGLRQPGGDAFLHDGHFVLVDRQGQIRGYYDGLDSEALERLLQDIRSLLRERLGF